MARASTAVAAEPEPEPDDEEMLLALGERLRTLREDAGLTRLAICRKTDVDPTTIARLETGTQSPTFRVLVRLARVYRLTVGELLEGIA